MRVISGSAKGRALKAVPGLQTRPTSDKVKEAIFSMIGPYFEGGTALDLFAGSGGLGIEAISRGLEKVIFIDIERASVDVIKHNLQATGLSDRAEIYRNSAEQSLKSLHKRAMSFDLVFLDPPYRMTNMDTLLQVMEQWRLLKDRALIVLEHDAKHQYAEQFGGFNRIRRAEYGDTAVSLYNWKLEAEISTNN